jgi:hypothetical protein
MNEPLLTPAAAYNFCLSFSTKTFARRGPIPTPRERKSSTNIPKTDATAKQHAYDPDAALEALSADVENPSRGMQGCIFRGRGRGRHHVGVGGEEERGASGADRAGEDKAGFRSVDYVPEDRVHQR